MRQSRRAPSECANCGAAIPPKALACPECGADERTGWRETSVYDDMELPDEAWLNDDDNSPTRPPDRRVNGIAWYWWCVAVLVLLFAGLVVLRLR